MANKDTRIKGCPNVNCECNKAKKQYKSDDMYCVKCGTKLVFACKKCFSKIEDRGPKHKICAACEAKKEDKVQRVLDVGEGAAKMVGGAIVGVGVKAAAEFVKAGEGEIIKGAKQGAKQVAKAAAGAVGNALFKK